jgi:hypothetical protein
VALSRSVSRLERRIRAKAADLAIKAHGTPAEVTGSDVEKAYRELLTAPDAHEYKLDSQRRRLRRSHMIFLMSTVYSWMGLVIAAFGVLYPYIHARLENRVFRFSMAIVVTGLTLSTVGFVLREYTRHQEAARKEEALRYGRFVIGRREPEE